MNKPSHSFSAIHERVSAGGADGVTGAFRDYTIASAFQPIFSLSHRNPVGYEALCRARLADGSAVSPLTLFGQAYCESDSVLIDRLCRAVHVRNFAACADKKSWIFLNVNPLVTVVGKNYGSFFEDMLAHNDIAPSQVVIEILEQNTHDESILAAAVNYYKELGCLVAIDDFGASHSNFDRIWKIQPDIVKFDRSIIVQAEASRVVRKALPSLVSLIQELGCIALMEGVETEQQALISLDSNVDLVQGYYFGYPRAGLVEQSDEDNMLSQLCVKHTAFSEALRVRYRETVDHIREEFKQALRVIAAGSKQPELACDKLLELPNVTRIYFLDELGFQIGKNVTNKQMPEYADPRYRPLSEATDANWSRRFYFRQAMLNPGEIQITRPYRSLTGKSQCITLSALLDTPGGKLVACLDLGWS
ncbi:MAG TPA: EAL domain-containing protein [Gallionella sp.]|nr:EAL domain-containing protein [Gallionella sp.]